MADLARNHHFIPEFFLASFTASGTKDGFLWVTDREERKGYSSRPRSAGFQKDLYRIDVEEAPSDIIERVFGWFEGYAAPAVRYVLANRGLPPRLELDHLMELIGLLVIRVPAARARVEAAIDRTMKAVLRSHFSDPQAVRARFEKMRREGVDIPTDIDYEELVAFAQSKDDYTVSVDKEWLLGQVLQASVPVQRMLFERNWSVVVPEHGAGEFICSDAPVCLTWLDQGRQDRIAPHASSSHRHQPHAAHTERPTARPADAPQSPNWPGATEPSLGHCFGGSSRSPISARSPGPCTQVRKPDTRTRSPRNAARPAPCASRDSRTPKAADRPSG